MIETVSPSPEPKVESRVGLAQIVSSADPEANLQQVRARVTEAADAGAALVVFPEATMRCFGRSLIEVAEPLDGPWATGVRKAAVDAGIVAVVGMFTPSPDGRVINTLLATGPGVEASYDKIHLYDAFGFAESDTVAPGAVPVVIDVDGVRVGLATCYDVRFPGLFTRLADDGAQVIALPTSWGSGPGKIDQWQLLVRARALDCTSYVLGAGQADPTTVGIDPRGTAPTGVGHSLIAAPDGSVVATLGAEPGLLVADLDLNRVEQVRRAVPVLANRVF